jgi:hypothetical protein
MRTTDLFKSNRAADKINESIEKIFGKRLNLESFDLAQLEDARNKLRTQIHTARSESGFNENLDNDAFTQAQWMLDAINSEIAEREEFIADPSVAEVSTDEAADSLEEEVIKLLKRFEENAMEIGAYGDPDINEVINHLKNGDAESAVETVWYSYSDQDGGEVPQIEPMVKDLQDEFEMLAQGGDADTEPDDNTDDGYALASAGHGSDEDYESVQYEDQVDEKAVSQAQQQAAGIALAARRKGETPSGKGAAAEMSKMSMKELEKFAGTKHKNLPAKKDESVDNPGEDMTKLQEGEVQQATAVVTAKTMVDRVGRWIEELSGMENDS